MSHSTESRDLVTHLERLIYRSKAASNLGHLHLFYLMSQTQVSNNQRGITGHLQYDHGVFIQYIEGPGEAVDVLWKLLWKRHEASGRGDRLSHTQINVIGLRDGVARRMASISSRSSSRRPTIESAWK